MLKSYLKEMRVHHYVKNLLVFVPLACSGQFFNFSKLMSGILGFVSFCVISSIVYIVNDINDVEKDRKHPQKCKRPIASGAISIFNAYVLIGVLAGIAIICNVFLGRISSLLILVTYLTINIMYSFGLKNIPIADISILASGFLLRVLYGALVTSIEISNWLYLAVISAAFYFALGKRRNEIRNINCSGETRKVLKFYTESFLDKNMYMCLALTNVFYALWSVDENIMVAYNSKYIIWTVPLVLIIMMKYSLDVEGDSDGDPTEVLLHDKALILLVLLYLVVMFSLLYIFR